MKVQMRGSTQNLTAAILSITAKVLFSRSKIDRLEKALEIGKDTSGTLLNTSRLDVFIWCLEITKCVIWCFKDNINIFRKRLNNFFFFQFSQI